MKSNRYIKPSDIISCEDEQIQIIGHIQDRGFLLGVQIDSHEVHYASANTLGFFNFSPLGVHISDLDKAFEQNGGKAFLQQQVEFVQQSVSTNNVYRVNFKGNTYDLITYKSRDFIVIELDVCESQEGKNTQQLLGEIMLKINPALIDQNEVFQELTVVLKELLGYDRVMVYKFHKDDHGEVIAESKEKQMEPFLGLHYPASDIPKQARELYKKNLTRVISDIKSVPIKIESNVTSPLDLSQSHIRSVSPIHVEYLNNMGVGASFSVSIIVSGELWGLVVCHHNSAKLVDLFKRKSSELISQYVSSLAATIEKNQNRKRFEENELCINALDGIMRRDWDVVKGLTQHAKNLLDVVESTGAAIFYDGELSVLGNVPPANEIHLLIDWFFENHSEDIVFSSEKMSLFIEELKGYSEVASGVLLVSISKDLKECILWFRPEQLTSVKWAGKDEKELVQKEDGRYRISPRKSFEVWKNQVLNTSVEWNDSDLSSANLLKEKILSIIQVKANEIEILNSKLQQAYNDLDSFSYTLSHDLRTPINTIQGYLELFTEENEEFQDDPLLKRALNSTEIMYDMIDNILEYSKLGRNQLPTEKVLINHILKDIKDHMVISKKFDNLIISLTEECSVLGNKTMIYQIFINIIENGIKYGHPERPAKIEVTCSEQDGMLLVCLQDNGVGIEVKNLNKIFNLFQRVNVDSKVGGTGVGLAIVKKIVSSHGGRVWVDSKLGVGSTFNILLPKYQ